MHRRLFMSKISQRQKKIAKKLRHFIKIVEFFDQNFKFFPLKMSQFGLKCETLNKSAFGRRYFEGPYISMMVIS